jgi:RNA polymerase sigma-70 factor, ECF subfamily
VLYRWDGAGTAGADDGGMPVARVDTRAERRADPTRRFDELFRRLYPRLYDLCHRLLVDRWEAEDVVQDAFLRLVGAAVLDRPDQEVEAWLRRVCLNLGYNRLRGRRRGRERLERASAELAPDGAAGERDDPLGSLLRLEQQAQVHRALWTLPERQRTCLLLRHAGYSYAEIADTCELAIGSVGVLLARAERTFRDSYQRQQQGADHEVP